MQDDTERQACCEEKVQSTAGREFCFADIIHPEGTFDTCDLATTLDKFECCTTLAQGDQSLEFDCQSTLTVNTADGECTT